MNFEQFVIFFACFNFVDLTIKENNTWNENEASRGVMVSKVD